MNDVNRCLQIVRAKRTIPGICKSESLVPFFFPANLITLPSPKKLTSPIFGKRMQKMSQLSQLSQSHLQSDRIESRSGTYQVLQTIGRCTVPMAVQTGWIPVRSGARVLAARWQLRRCVLHSLGTHLFILYSCCVLGNWLIVECILLMHV